MNACKARLQADEWHCARCRLRWDQNEEAPPSCKAAAPLSVQFPNHIKLAAGVPHEKRSLIGAAPADRGWCQACGVGNDKLGLRHAPACARAPSQPWEDLVERTERGR